MLVLEERIVTIPVLSRTAIGRAMPPSLTRALAVLPLYAIARNTYLVFCQRLSRHLFPSEKGKIAGKTEKPMREKVPEGDQTQFQ